MQNLAEENNMKFRFLTLLLAGLLLVAGLAYLAADAAKTYQVTGPVVSVTDTTITVMKGNEKWEIAKDTNTKVTGDIKEGAKVTIMYRMTATSVEVKETTAKPAKKKP